MSSTLFQQVVDATIGEYVLHAALGQSEILGDAFLAREVATGRSVVLLVPPGAESLDVVGALSDTVPADAGGCASCGFRVSAWVDACPRCEHVMIPPAAPATDETTLREQLRGTIDVVASVPHVHGGTTHFGREVGQTRLTAFVIRPQPDGQLALDVIWEAADDSPHAVHGAPAGVAAVPAIAGAYETAPADAQASHAAYDASSGAGYAEPAGAYSIGSDTAPRRRRWLPIGLGVGALALVGVVFAFTRGTTPPPRPATAAPDTGTRAPNELVGTPNGMQSAAGGPSAAGGATAGTSATGAVGGTEAVAINRDSVLRDSITREFRRRRHDSLRLLRSQQAAGPKLTIDGDLPSGWSLSVDGSGATTDRSVRLVAGRPTVIRIQAPGYCPDTLLVTPSGQDDKHWAPTLQGKPLRGEC